MNKLKTKLWAVSVCDEMKYWTFKRCLYTESIVCLLCYMLNFTFCLSLNQEGLALLRFKERVSSDPQQALSNWRHEIGMDNHCSWFGVECLQGHVVALNLKDLCLRGTLAPEIGDLIHLKSIMLRNNSFAGLVPDKVADLKELEVLDLGNNNFSGQLPDQLGNGLSMAVLLLDNNDFLESRRPQFQKLSEAQLKRDWLSSSMRAPSCNELMISRDSGKSGIGAKRRSLREPPSGGRFIAPPGFTLNNIPPPASSPPPIMPEPPNENPHSEPLAPSPSASPVVPISPRPIPAPAEGPQILTKLSRKNHSRLLVPFVAAGGSLLLVLILGVVLWQCGKVATVKPWATGLSGQLQRAFVTGVPKLKRSELEAACEGFSNVIGSFPFWSLYKGTLSNGTEIAVASIAVASAKDWSSSLEAQFRKKISTLSKVNHKNFSSLLGYCIEDEPFTRMMVFEYAPNGTLFEHLHIREAEHLDWATRLRIAMGVAYCLEHMHQLTPPLPHRNLNSSAVYLTEDYATKLSDFAFSSAAETEPNTASNVYSLGAMLFEMMTGRLLGLAGRESLEHWASDYLSGRRPLTEMVDPMLETYSDDQLQQIDDLIRLCIGSGARRRPSMGEVCARLREITGIEPDGAIPKLSPLWWAELEITAADAS